MFYSHTFLGRKGPLATVWIAAHLQHRLKKSHYTSTNIPSTIEHIMDPGAPVALRLSGHLLLGIVRIYSKKVDYLVHDCSVVLTSLNKAFASIQLNLPEDARQAPVQSITLPETFDLDAVNLDDEPDHNGIEDKHQKNQEDITIPDQMVMEQFIVVSFDEDIRMDSSNTEVLPDSGVGQMEEDTILQSPLKNVGFQDGGPSIQRESPTTPHSAGDRPHNVQDPEVTRDVGPGDTTSPQAAQPTPEILRDANDARNVENPLVYPNPEDKDTVPSGDLDETMKEKDHIPEMMDVDPEGIPAPSEQHLGPQTPVTSHGDASDAQVFVGHSSPLVLRESPPIQQHPKRGRKRKQFFDDPIVLTNRFMRGALNNPQDILKKRREAPSSALGTWKLNNIQRKEQMFDQPLLTGICKDHIDISKREYICSKPHLVISEEDHEDVGIARTSSPTNQIPEEPRPVTPVAVSIASPVLDSEIEHIRLNVAASPPRMVPSHDVGVELNIEGEGEGNVGRDDLNSISTQNLRSVSVSPERTNIATGSMDTPDLATSSAAPGSMMETPTTYVGESSRNLGLSDIHQLINSAATEELSFLEMDNNSPASLQSTGEGLNMSTRTRAVAEFFKSRIAPILEDPAEDLSLNKILEGKTRRISACMFYSILVLKSYGHIDVHQEQPYGDISLNLTPSLNRHF
ncbi:sister chromatid cohesion 1 protein 3 [Arachis duranensis]|uniref:Sister chromatid cohesion 1 protein 3 n=1 Tax=Arachis duranensis TaxID=130453 RepID=A0A6P4DP13_ARADU|nr:sister chromatid cohesion 1 protein 3 [Arachis duranensis]XP_015971538.1 sister chromatid cohesion 1 protein 3 [Arachis duranensis]